jgi:hypothetical protein
VLEVLPVRRVPVYDRCPNCLGLGKVSMPAATPPAANADFRLDASDQSNLRDSVKCLDCDGLGWVDSGYAPYPCHPLFQQEALTTKDTIEALQVLTAGLCDLMERLGEDPPTLLRHLRSQLFRQPTPAKGGDQGE